MKKKEMKSSRNFIENKYNVDKKKAKTMVGGKWVGEGVIPYQECLCGW